MSLTGCYAVLKYLIFLLNLAFWFSGLTILVLSVWMLIDPTFYISMAQDESSYYSGVCLLFLAGAVLFLVGFVGCFGAYNESPRLLILFFCGLLLLLVAQISAGTWAYTNSDKLKHLLYFTVQNTVKHEYGRSVSHRTDSFDAIQSGLQCCGAYGPDDWSGSSWKGNENNIKLSVNAALQYYEIPKSCCNTDYSESECNKAVKTYVTSPVSKVIYSQGCSEKLLEKLTEYFNLAVMITIGAIIIEFSGLITSLILCCAIRAVSKYK